MVDRFTELIMEARKNGDSDKAEVLKLIKARLMEFTTQPKAPVLTEDIGIQILNKMIKELRGDLKIAVDNNRTDLAKEAMYQIDVISEFVPKNATEEEINKYLDTLDTDLFYQSNMGNIIKAVKSAFKYTDGSLVAKLVKNRLHE